MAKPRPDTFNKESSRKPDPNVVQRQASDPAASVWVTASAGTGKTKVLTDRVLRLMLSGAAPESILCVTFTTAASALMTIRIREELSQWATMDKAALAERLEKLTGEKPDAQTQARARQLFAEFLDASNGMRIQTIHALAQDMIRRFPIESGIPPYFEVMDDQTASDLLRDARAQVLRDVQKNPNTPLAQAVRMVTPEVAEDDFVNLIGELTYRRGELLSIFARKGGLEETIESVYSYLDAPEDTDSKALNDMLNSDNGLYGDAPDVVALNAAAELLATGSSSDLEKAKMIKAWLLHPEQRAEFFWDYAAVFLTADGVTRKTLATKKCAEAIPAMTAEAERLMRGIDAISSMNVARGTESILRLTSAILDTYAEKKRTLNLLDYDDLIHSVNVMMREDGAARWALHKLPGDIKHILVDEAQDTNPDQWELVGSLVRELFAQQQKAPTPAQAPTLFVVGDEKQSIFSFQRADPREFAQRKKDFAELVKKAGGEWRALDMDIAFRSSPAITRAVDAVFANPAASDGLFSRDAAPDKQVRHEPFRRGQAGLVEIHPVVTGTPTPDPEAWSLPLPSEEENAVDPGQQLADKIADQIKGWLDSKEKLPARGRAISPSDIMVLVRRRSAFVDQLVRALKKRDIPVSGADRLSLREQIVVMDLVALGEWLLFPRDDYKLACILKSPLIGLSDAQLEQVAAGRKGDLWTSLQAAAAKDGADEAFKNAVEYLSDLQARYANGRPYEFYSGILMNDCAARRGDGKPQSGLNALYARLGFEAEDPMVEFMNAIERYEKLNAPSLQGFLAWLEAGEAEVKRQVNLNPESPRVNIMTVHSAKGLEAPIVILPDTTGLPEDNTRARPRFLWPDNERDVPLWVPRADLECNAFRRERNQVEQERDREFRRLLYVAMTRAADRLYVHGHQNAARANGKSWYELIVKGVTESLDKDVSIDEETGIIRFGTPQTVKPQPDGVDHQQRLSVVGVPKWARTAAPQAVPSPLREKFRPSEYLGTNDNDRAALSPLATPADDYHARLGTAVHALLEFLPGTPVQGREGVIKAYLSQPRWNLSEEDQKATARQVTGLLKDARFGAIFGDSARAEVSLTGQLWHDGQPRQLSGQVDRLVVEGNTVTIVDYKNGKHVPKQPESAPKKYIVQMAAYRMALKKMYPDKDVRCALLWTRTATLMELPNSLLDATLAEVKLSASAPVAPTAPAAKTKASKAKPK